MLGIFKDTSNTIPNYARHEKEILFTNHKYYYAKEEENGNNRILLSRPIDSKDYKINIYPYARNYQDYFTYEYKINNFKEKLIVTTDFFNPDNNRQSNDTGEDKKIFKTFFGKYKRLYTF